MHHPDICNILLIIQDFLLLSDNQANCEIIPLPSYCTVLGGDDEILVQQVCIRRRLSAGWLEVVIHGFDKNSNLSSCEYLTCLEPRTCVRSIELDTDRYSIDLVKDAVREILIMDKKPQFSSLDSIRNSHETSSYS